MSYFIIIYSIAFLIAGSYFLWLYLQFSKGQIGLDGPVGIKTKSIMKTKETWKKVHKRYAFSFLVLAIGFIFTGIFSICQLIYNGSADKIPHLNYLSSFIPIIIAIIISFTAFIFANIYAKRLPPPREKTEKIKQNNKP